MDGSLVLAKVSALRVEGFLDGEEVPTTLLAAVFAEALRQGRPPRKVLDALWEALPPDDLWEQVSDDLIFACESLEE